MPNGRVPTVGQVAANPSLIKDTGTNDLQASVAEATGEFFTDEWKELMAKDLYEAHTVCTTFYFSKKNSGRYQFKFFFADTFFYCLLLIMYLYITIESTRGKL